jgi:2-iminobutanoate/2-iminopropanoate deaminase
MTTHSQIRKPITPKPGGAAHGPGMTPGTIAGGFIFLSAIRGNGPRGTTMSDNTKDQARQAFENLKLLLEGAGATLDHVCKVTLYLHDLKYRQDFHEVWMEYFPENPPARIAIQVEDANASAGGPQAHFALDVMAVAP